MCVLTPKAFCYVAFEEGLVQEAYKDSDTPPVWTWACGVAATSGYNVLQWKDKAAPIETCIAESIKWMEAKFIPILHKAVGAVTLTENQIAAAISFAWRNGTLNAQWMTDFLGGHMDRVHADWLNWTNHGTEVARATREADLFCKGIWPTPMDCPIYGVSKPEYKPAHPKATDISAIVRSVMGV